MKAALAPLALLLLVGSACSDDSLLKPNGGGAGNSSVGGNSGVGTDRVGGNSGVGPSGVGGSGTSATGPGEGGQSPGTAGATSTEPTGPGSYALAPPSQCHNSDWVEGCTPGNAGSACGGKCQVINACQEDETSKPGADVGFICPRFMLLSDEMLQAAADDGNTDFNYAIVGHDVDGSGIDGAVQSTCCQCYQLVFAHPSVDLENQCLVDPNDKANPVSALTIPKPLIVQSFNTAATPTSFDVYMAAGGFGANNSCGPGQQPASKSGLYLYTAYPTDGQSSQGGVKPVSLYQECKTATNWVTNESLSSSACQTRVAGACNQLESSIPGLTEQARRSCSGSNSPESPYHLNWSVYAMKVECPQHLTEVTGCKLDPQGLPAVDRSALTAAQAAANSKFWTKSSEGKPYHITTMEDCCRPSCAAKNWVSGKGLKSDPLYNAFYTCDVNGKPYLEE